MLKAYKDLYTIYFCVAFGVSIVLALGIFPFTDFSFPGLLIYFVLVFASSSLINALLNKKAVKRLAETVELLNNCQAGAYVHQVSQLLQRNAVQGTPSVCKTLQYYLAMGYSALGDHVSAIAIAQQNVAQGFQPREWSLQVAFQNNLTKFYENAGDWNNARYSLENLKCMAADSRTIKNQSLLATIEQRIVFFEQDFAILEGRGESVRAALEIEFSTTHSLYTKVSFAYQLATICLQMSDKEKAKEYLLFAQQNGGDTWYTGLAAARLAELAN